MTTLNASGTEFTNYFYVIICYGLVILPLWPSAEVSEGWNTLLHEGFANVNTRKRLIHRHYYIPSFLVQVFSIQSKKNLSKFLAEGINVH